MVRFEPDTQGSARSSLHPGLSYFGPLALYPGDRLTSCHSALPPNERAEVARFVVANGDSWVPEEFKEGMADAAAGRFVDMEMVLSGAKPPPREAE